MDWVFGSEALGKKDLERETLRGIVEIFILDKLERPPGADSGSSNGRKVESFLA